VKLLAFGSFHMHLPWMTRARAWASNRTAVEAVAITGNMLNMLISPAEQSLLLRDWIASLPCSVYYARGPWDPPSMEDWDLPNLHLCGDHIQAGWRIHVIGDFEPVEEIEPTTSQTLIFSHSPPALTRCSIAPDGTHHGSIGVRQAIADAGDCRLAVCGRVIDPASTTDWCENAMVINPGVSLWDTQPSDPAHAIVDTDARTFILHNGRRTTCHSFARQ
jgi:hypothetical protein